MTRTCLQGLQKTTLRLDSLLRPVIVHPGLMSDYHFGGIKIQLSDGQEGNLFNTWLYNEGWAWGAVNYVRLRDTLDLLFLESVQ